MQPRDKINKSSWILHESVKDAITANIISAIHSGQLKIEAASVEKLLMVINASADEGYHRGIRTFMKITEDVLSDMSQDVELLTSMPELANGSVSKKK